MKQNLRLAILALLFFGPIMTYVTFGAFWLRERGWGLYGFGAWLCCGLLFGFLSVHWTRVRRQAVLPAIDWTAPDTFAPIDREAWAVVEREAELSESLSATELVSTEVYAEAGRRLAKSLVSHYHPGVTDPFEPVAIADALTAIELAAEDLNRLVREIPGGDLVTPGHWKKAVQAAGWFQKANEVYSYLLPIFQPLTGLVRLSSQKLVSEPAMKGMQQNVMRWLYRAYVNRLGLHLVELYSGRLSMGAEAYRRLSIDRGSKRRSPYAEALPEHDPNLMVLGTRSEDRARVIESLGGVIEQLNRPTATAGNGATNETPLHSVIGRATLSEISGDRWLTAQKAASDRVAQTKGREADALFVVLDPASSTDSHACHGYLTTWSAWFASQPRRSTPAVVFVVKEAELPDPLAGFTNVPPIRFPNPLGQTELARFQDELAATLLALAPRIDQVALVRQLSRVTSRSKTGRLVRELGHHGKHWIGDLWAAQRDRLRPRR
jgi:hypothetical protein